MKKIIFIITSLAVCECVYVYSSFWAPLFDPRILNYRVDSNFDPDGGKNSREAYERKYGYRGKNFIADLGNGKGPSNDQNEQYEEVKFYYTYPGANTYKI